MNIKPFLVVSAIYLSTQAFAQTIGAQNDMGGNAVDSTPAVQPGSSLNQIPGGVGRTWKTPESTTDVIVPNPSVVTDKPVKNANQNNTVTNAMPQLKQSSPNSPAGVPDK